MEGGRVGGNKSAYTDEDRQLKDTVQLEKQYSRLVRMATEGNTKQKYVLRKNVLLQQLHNQGPHFRVTPHINNITRNKTCSTEYVFSQKWFEHSEYGHVIDTILVYLLSFIILRLTY